MARTGSCCITRTDRDSHATPRGHKKWSSTFSENPDSHWCQRPKICQSNVSISLFLNSFLYQTQSNGQRDIFQDGSLTPRNHQFVESRKKCGSPQVSAKNDASDSSFAIFLPSAVCPNSLPGCANLLESVKLLLPAQFEQVAEKVLAEVTLISRLLKTMQKNGGFLRQFEQVEEEIDDCSVNPLIFSDLQLRDSRVLIGNLLPIQYSRNRPHPENLAISRHRFQLKGSTTEAPCHWFPCTTTVKTCVRKVRFLLTNRSPSNAAISWRLFCCLLLGLGVTACRHFRQKSAVCFLGDHSKELGSQLEQGLTRNHSIPIHRSKERAQNPA